MLDFSALTLLNCLGQSTLELDRALGAEPQLNQKQVSRCQAALWPSQPYDLVRLQRV